MRRVALRGIFRYACSASESRSSFSSVKISGFLSWFFNFYFYCNVFFCHFALYILKWLWKMMLMLMIDHWNIEILFLKENLFYPKIIFFLFIFINVSWRTHDVRQNSKDHPKVITALGPWCIKFFKARQVFPNE